MDRVRFLSGFFVGLLIISVSCYDRNNGSNTFTSTIDSSSTTSTQSTQSITTTTDPILTSYTSLTNTSIPSTSTNNTLITATTQTIISTTSTVMPSTSTTKTNTSTTLTTKTTMTSTTTLTTIITTTLTTLTTQTTKTTSTQTTLTTQTTRTTTTLTTITSITTLTTTTLTTLSTLTTKTTITTTTLTSTSTRTTSTQTTLTTQTTRTTTTLTTITTQTTRTTTTNTTQTTLTTRTTTTITTTKTSTTNTTTTFSCTNVTIYDGETALFTNSFANLGGTVNFQNVNWNPYSSPNHLNWGHNNNSTDGVRYNITSFQANASGTLTFFIRHKSGTANAVRVALWDGSNYTSQYTLPGLTTSYLQVSVPLSSLTGTFNFNSVQGIAFYMTNNGTWTEHDIDNISFECPLGPTITTQTTVYTGTVTTTSMGSCSDSCPAPNGGVTWFCKKRFMYGLNYAWKNFGGDFGGISAWGQNGVSNNVTAITNELSQMKAAGASVVRWWIFPDFRGDGVVFNVSNNPTGLGGTAVADLQKALQIADGLDLYIMLTLFSFDNFKPDENVGGIFVRGIQPMVTNAARRAMVINNIVVPVAQAVEASPYKNRMIAWDIINEPEWAESGSNGIDPVYTPIGGLQTVTHSQMQTFIDDCITALRANSTALITIGQAAVKWSHDFTDTSIDFYQFHWYEWVENSFTHNTSPATYGIGDKPAIVGEFPMGNLDNSPVVSYDTAVTNLWNKGWAGALSWSYSDRVPTGASLSNITPFYTAHSCETTY